MANHLVPGGHPHWRFVRASESTAKTELGHYRQFAGIDNGGRAALIVVFYARGVSDFSAHFSFGTCFGDWLAGPGRDDKRCGSVRAFGAWGNVR